MNSPLILETKKLAVGYFSNSNKKIICQDVNICLERGSILAIIGPNGSGKTTILKTCTHLLKAIDGEIFIDGKESNKISISERANTFSWVPQNSIIPWDYSVSEIVLQGRFASCGVFHSYTKEDYEIVNNSIKLMDLTDFADRLYSSLSQGESRRVLIARALAQNTPLLFFDEPEANLDAKRQLEMMKIIKSLAKSGKSIVVSIHDINLALHFAEFVLLVSSDGQTEFGKTNDILLPEKLERAFGSPFILGNDEKFGKYLLPIAK